MEQFEMTVTAQQALFLRSAPRAGNRQTTTTTITGSTLRGAVAALWLAEHGQPDAVFRELFETGVVWPTLRPHGHELVPMSVRRCKYRGQPQCNTTAFDTFQAQAPSAQEVEATCPVCGGPLELSKGDLVPTGSGNRVATVTRTNVSLTDAETARDGELFSRDAVAVGTRLQGRAPLPNALSPQAKTWLNGLAGRRLRVGGRRSVAGSITIDGVSWPALDTLTTTPQGHRVALRLATPAIVLDVFGATTTAADHLLLGTPLEGRLAVDANASLIRPETAGGWNALAGLPRPDDTAWSAGSTVVAQVTDPAGITGDEWLAFVLHGVGTRRSEGFGTITVDSEAWRFPAATASRPEPTARTAPQQPALLELVRELPGGDDERADAADWFTGRLRDFAGQLRDATTGDTRASMADDAMRERRLRRYAAPIVEAYYVVLADSALSPDDLERLARLMGLLSYPESMQEQS